jgi:hypothetical protein
MMTINQRTQQSGSFIAIFDFVPSLTDVPSLTLLLNGVPSLINVQSLTTVLLLISVQPLTSDLPMSSQ